MIAPAAPTLTGQTVPGPGVEVYFPTLDAAVDSITVWRIANGVTVEVRGAKFVSASGAFTVTDWEVPFGILSTYYGEVFDIVGASLISPQSTITVLSNDVILSNPIDPGQQMVVKLERETFSQIPQSRRTQQVFVMGVRLPYEQNWGLSGLSGLPFNVWTSTDAEALVLQTILQASPLLIRTPPRFSTLPRNLSASIKSPTQVPFDWRTEGTTIVWQLTVDEVQPVSAAVLRPLVTWGRYEAGFPTPDLWSDVSAIYGGGTWIDMQRNPPIV